jgi:hypothetical protein
MLITRKNELNETLNSNYVMIMTKFTIKLTTKKNYKNSDKKNQVNRNSQIFFEIFNDPYIRWFKYQVGDCLILKIHPEAPFNFDLSAKIFSNGDSQIQSYENGSYWQVIHLNARLVLVTIRSTGTVDNPELTVEVLPDKNLDNDDGLVVTSNVTTIFNLDFNLKNFYDDMNVDEVMSKLTA